MKHAQKPSSDYPLEQMLTQEQVAKLLHKTVPTLVDWRYKGKGPSYVKIGRTALYHPEQVRAFINANTVTSVQEQVDNYRR